MFTSPSSLAPRGSTGPRQKLSKRSRRLATVATAKKEGKAKSSSKSKSKAATEDRLARLLNQYGDEEAIQRQLEEAEQYSRRKNEDARGAAVDLAKSREERRARLATQATAPPEAAEAAAAEAGVAAVGSGASSGSAAGGGSDGSQQLSQSDAAEVSFPGEQGSSRGPVRRSIGHLVFKADPNDPR